MRRLDTIRLNVKRLGQLSENLYAGSLEKASLVGDVYVSSNSLVNSVFFEYHGRARIRRIEHSPDLESESLKEAGAPSLYELTCGSSSFRFVPRKGREKPEVSGSDATKFASIPISTKFHPLKGYSAKKSKEFLCLSPKRIRLY